MEMGFSFSVFFFYFYLFLCLLGDAFYLFGIVMRFIHFISMRLHDMYAMLSGLRGLSTYIVVR